MSMIEDKNGEAEAPTSVPKQEPIRAIRPEWVARFKQEAEVHLVQITKGLQLLPPVLGQALTTEETAKEQYALRELFRHAHSVKGSARMIGLAEVAEKASLLEEILGQAYLEPTHFVSLLRTNVQQQVDFLMGLIKGTLNSA
jgi:chemotaxis protein histidine kinase CheA